MKRVIKYLLITIILFILTLVINFVWFQYNANHISIGKPIPKYSKIDSALLIIDIQEATTGILSDNDWYIKRSDTIINNINQIAHDFVSKNIPVIYIKSEISNPFINILNSSYAVGSKVAMFDNRLEILSSNIVSKSSSDAFYKTNLDSILLNNEISELFIVGLDAEFCINSTVMAGLNRNYIVKIYSDAVLAKSPFKLDSMLTVFKDKNVEIIK